MDFGYGSPVVYGPIVIFSAWAIAAIAFFNFCFLLTRIAEIKRYGTTVKGLVFAAYVQAGMSLQFTLFAVATGLGFNWDGYLYPLCVFVLIGQGVSFQWLFMKDKAAKKNLSTARLALQKKEAAFLEREFINGARH